MLGPPEFDLSKSFLVPKQTDDLVSQVLKYINSNIPAIPTATKKKVSKMTFISGFGMESSSKFHLSV